VLTVCTECGQHLPYAQYATAPNDVWSLGVVLINLVSGRNPWKAASSSDTTFRAFLKDGNFLSTILPISPELNDILRQVFECDPRRRISLSEFRDLILACPRLTNTLPLSPPPSPYAYVDTVPYPQSSEWSLYEPTSKQGSSCSSRSTDSGYESETYPETMDPNPFNFYGNVLPFQEQKVYYQSPTYPSSAMAY
jgi:serine/threonine protein kinase